MIASFGARRPVRMGLFAVSLLIGSGMTLVGTPQIAGALKHPWLVGTYQVSVPNIGSGPQTLMLFRNGTRQTAVFSNGPLGGSSGTWEVPRAYKLKTKHFMEINTSAFVGGDICANAGLPPEQCLLTFVAGGEESATGIASQSAPGSVQVLLDGTHFYEVSPFWAVRTGKA